MSTFTVHGAPAGGLHGRLRVPGDKSISHRAVLLAARAEGRSQLDGPLRRARTSPTPLAAVAACGAGGHRAAAPARSTVDGGAGRLHEPDGGP